MAAGHQHEDSFGLSAGTIDDVLSCPVCLELFKTPKVLPDCGHSFCSCCLTKILQLSNEQNRIACPECRVVSSLPINNGSSTNHTGVNTTSRFVDAVNGLRTNIQLQRTVSLYELSVRDRDAMEQEQKIGKINFSSFTDVCPHVFLTKSPLNCNHCGGKFCNGCGIAHMEKMKLEMISMSSKVCFLFLLWKLVNDLYF